VKVIDVSCSKSFRAKVVQGAEQVAAVEPPGKRYLTWALGAGSAAVITAVGSTATE
jgi:hypothetical protein